MENKIIKVIYFDEEAAIDYITISDGGKTISEIVNTQKESDSSSTEGQLEIGAGLPFFNWIKLKSKIGVNANITNMNDEVIKSTLSNTILTDYLNKVKEDNCVEKFTKYKIVPIDDSISYYKLYTPYTLLIKKELNDKISDEVDITKLDDVLKEVKGYYEFLGKKEDQKIIFRFNISSFKNNYKISNLLSMDLLLYGVKVGSANLSDFSIEKEFNVNNTDITVDDVLGNADGNSQIYNELPIYDIVLAGVTYENNKN